MIRALDSEAEAGGAAVDLELLTRRVFDENGWLVRDLGLEFRPQQASMALSVAQALVGESGMLIEAGTGVGKSIAYLVPGVMRAVTAKRPLVVSSHTIALQQQLMSSDLPRVRELFSSVKLLEPFADFRAALLLGRGNYLCGHRLGRALSGQTDLFQAQDEADLQRIAEWAEITKSGLREELNPAPRPEVWEWVNADSSSCNRKNCTPETCFFRRALAERQKAHVLIVNHALLFSLIAAGMPPAGQTPGILFPGDAVILDEAHTIPGIATDHFGLAISSYGVNRQLQRLYNPAKHRGLLARNGSPELQKLTAAALRVSDNFFRELADRFLTGVAPVRLSQPDWIEPRLNEPFGRLIAALRKFRSEVTDGALRDELSDSIDHLGGIRDGVAEVVAVREEEHVYWLERAGRKGTVVHLRSAPLDVSAPLRDALFRRNSAVVLTSATLTAGDRMEAFSRRVGASGVEARIETSPFDYLKNMEVWVARDVPEPTAGHSRLDIEVLSTALKRLVLAVDGGTLALFTSYLDLNRVLAEVQGPLEQAGRLVLAQGPTQGRAELKRQFVEDGRALLLGADSFWTGFDVPGSALSQVVIMRLPFEPPTHPVSEARAELVRSRGGNPFADLVLPDSIVRFRQGIGRLIRSRTDSGRIIVLDSRVLRKSYGRSFLGAFPTPRYKIFDVGKRKP